MRIRRSVLSLAALALIVTSCSDDGGLSAEEQEFADAWSVTLQDEEDGFSVPEEDADCMGAAMMSELGTDPFDNAEVTPDDIGGSDDANSPGELLGDGVISDAQADAILDVWEEDCVDLPQVLGESAATEFELDEEGVTCFVDGLEDGLARDVLRSSFTSGSDEPPEEALSTLLNLLQSCGQTDGEGGFIVDSIAESFAADGNLDEEQAQCVAQSIVDALGVERLTAMFSEGGGIEDLPPDAQQEFTQALLDAAEDCDVPLSALGG